jgi:hypothetical protein
MTLSHGKEPGNNSINTSHQFQLMLFSEHEILVELEDFGYRWFKNP